MCAAACWPRCSDTTAGQLNDERNVLRRVAPASLVFLPLVSRNEEGELEGRLARRWEHSPDYRIWTIHLRTDVRWHDGEPVSAHDIKFTLDLRCRREAIGHGNLAVLYTDRQKSQSNVEPAIEGDHAVA